jgi:hypothetical protein
MTARIYRPAKTAMQSGTGNAQQWLLEFVPEAARSVDSLMGWTGSPDTDSQVRIPFPSREAAVAFAEANKLAYEVSEPAEHRPKIKAYADNFRYDRIE